MGFTLLESKIDLFKFKDKFGEEALNFFQKYNQTLINNKISTDLTYHIKNTTKEEMNNIIHDLENKVIKSDSGEVKLDRTFIGETSDYKVYKINDWETSMNMGEGTSWCIAGRYDTDEVKPSQAKRYFNEYVGKGVTFYFLMSKRKTSNKSSYNTNEKAEYCICVYEYEINEESSFGHIVPRTVQIWDKYDTQLDYLDMDKIWISLPKEIRSKIKADSTTGENGLVIRDNEVLAFDGDGETAVVPEGITSIYSYAFAEKYMKHVQLPDSLERIGDYAFAKSYYLEDISIPPKVSNLIEAGTFFKCKSLKSIEFRGNDITAIRKMAFAYTGLEEIRIPEGVVSLSGKIFYGCGNLKKIYLPSSLKYINFDTFEECPNLEEIIVKGGKKMENILFTVLDVSSPSGEIVSYEDYHLTKNMVKYID